jgi:ABC-2 type transport system ATP-binding protein
MEYDTARMSFVSSVCLRKLVSADFALTAEYGSLARAQRYCCARLNPFSKSKFEMWIPAKKQGMISAVETDMSTKTENAPILEIIDLKKVFHLGFFRKRVDAVKHVSFLVREGEVFGLLGPNGAGKTTIIKTMMGLIRPSAGKIQISGIDSSNPNARAAVGYLPENPYFHEYLNPRELLTFHGRLAGMSAQAIRERRDLLIEKVGLKDASKRPLRKFSKGMLQRIGVALALIGDPQILILDEPMSGLDPIGRRFMVDLMSDLNRQGKTILFSSHILSDVERLCRRVVILNRGEVVAEGAIEDLLKGEKDISTFEDLFMRKAFENKEP